MNLSILIILMALGQAGMHIQDGAQQENTFNTLPSDVVKEPEVERPNFAIQDLKVQEQPVEAKKIPKVIFNKLPSVAVGVMAKPLSDIDRFRFLGALGFESPKFKEYRSAVLEHAFPLNGPIESLARFIRVAKNQKIKLGDPDAEMYWTLKIQDEIQDHYLKCQHQGAPYPVVANTEGQALLSASTLGHDKVVAYAIKKEYDLNVSDTEGKTPLMRAVAGNRTRAARRLINAGATADSVDSARESALHCAARKCSDEGILRHLINTPGLGDGQTDTGWTPLHVAVKHRNYACMKALIKGKVNMNLRTVAPVVRAQVRVQYGYTPLGYAVDYKYAQAVTVLIDGDADLNRETLWTDRWRDPKGVDTPLVVAIRHRSEGIALALIDAGADVSLGNPLQHAVECNSDTIVERLLEAGVDPNLAGSSSGKIKAMIEGAGGTL